MVLLRYTQKKIKTFRPSLLFRRMEWLGFILIFLGLFWMLFPGSSLLKTIIQDQYFSQADFRYAILLLQQKVSEKIKYSTIEKNPLSLLQYLKSKTTDDADVLWLKYSVLMAIRYKEHTPPRFKKSADILLSEFLALFLSQPTTVNQDKKLIKDALALNQQSLALEFYKKIIQKAPLQTMFFYAQAAQVALWANNCHKSAEYYFIAQDKASAIDDKRYFFINALKTLFQCNEYTKAMEAMEKHIGDLRDDEQTYVILTELALKADQPAKAKEFVIRLLQLKQRSSTGLTQNSKDKRQLKR